MGFCLCHEKDGMLHPVSYSSRKFSESEYPLSTIETELLAMATGILKYSKFLLCSHFIVIVDHKPIKYLHTKSKISNQRIHSLLLWLQEFSFTVFFPGTENIKPDMLLRP